MNMPDLPSLLGFIVTCVIIELTPGPNMAYLAILASGAGRRAGLTAVAGVALGLLVVGLAAGTGLAAAVSQSETLYQALRWGGVLYMLWLAWDAWRAHSDIAPEKENGPFKVRYFRRGLVTNLLNPKAAIFYIAVLPEFFDPSQALIPQAVSLTLLYVSIATIIHSSIVFLAHLIHRFLASENPLYVRRTLAVLLVLVAVWMAWKTGR